MPSSSRTVKIGCFERENRGYCNLQNCRSDREKVAFSFLEKIRVAAQIQERFLPESSILKRFSQNSAQTKSVQIGHRIYICIVTLSIVDKSAHITIQLDGFSLNYLELYFSNVDFMTFPKNYSWSIVFEILSIIPNFNTSTKKKNNSGFVFPK